MNELKNHIERPELLKAIRDSIGDARSAVKELASSFTNNVRTLRLEESENVFAHLTQNIQDLECFLRFISELKEGIGFFDRFGLPDDPISVTNSGLTLFQEMHTAFETRDWIMLSDLIEYELSPLLLKEEAWLGSLGDKVVAYDM